MNGLATSVETSLEVEVEFCVQNFLWNDLMGKGDVVPSDRINAAHIPVCFLALLSIVKNDLVDQRTDCDSPHANSIEPFCTAHIFQPYASNVR